MHSEQGVDSFSTIVLHLKRPVLPDLGNLSFWKNFFFDMAVFFYFIWINNKKPGRSCTISYNQCLIKLQIWTIQRDKGINEKKRSCKKDGTKSWKQSKTSLEWKIQETKECGECKNQKRKLWSQQQ